MIDTHSHINFPELFNDVESVFASATSVGVTKVVVPATTVDTSESSLELARQFPGWVYGCVGIHPCHAHEVSMVEQRAYAQSIKWDEVTAVGEIGFDAYHLPSDAEKADKMLELQRATFVFWLELAIQHNKPVIIHSREAFDLTGGILSEMAEGHPVVIHCFTGGFEEAHFWLELGFHLSVTGVITYKKNDELRDVVSQLPLERLMIETDAPFLSPEGMRNKTCEPAFVRAVAEKLAEIHFVSFDEIDEITSANAQQFFRLS